MRVSEFWKEIDRTPVIGDRFVSSTCCLQRGCDVVVRQRLHLRFGLNWPTGSHDSETHTSDRGSFGGHGRSDPPAPDATYSRSAQNRKKRNDRIAITIKHKE